MVATHLSFRSSVLSVFMVRASYYPHWLVCVWSSTVRADVPVIVSYATLLCHLHSRVQPSPYALSSSFSHVQYLLHNSCRYLTMMTDLARCAASA
jgi:membrane-bound acyltransferase YfiQ involved in biofilm formation